MLKLKPEIVESIKNAKTVQELYPFVEDAIILEFSTIPPYLTGAFSVQPGCNQEAVGLVKSVVYEEMLHMTLACNLLTAIGGNPKIFHRAEELVYPTPLPDYIDPSLQVTLNSLSKDQLGTVFMGIEHPDVDPKLLPGGKEPGRDTHHDPPGSYNSIADFYNALMKKLVMFPYAFQYPRLESQIDITKYFPPVNPSGVSFNGKILDVTTAYLAVEVIINQGEGAKVNKDPIDPTGGFEGSFAHYFKFGEIYYGKRLIKSNSDPSGWSYAGDPVELDEKGIYTFLPNASLSMYKEGELAYIKGSAFYGAFQRLLRALEQVFNGQPDTLRSAIGIMYELKLLAGQMVKYGLTQEMVNSGVVIPTGAVITPPFMS